MFQLLPFAVELPDGTLHQRFPKWTPLLAVFLVEILVVGVTLGIDFLKQKNWIYSPDRQFARQAFSAIVDGDLRALKRHPLLQIGVDSVPIDSHTGKEIRKDLNKFKALQEYGNNFMLLTAVDQGYLEIVKFLLEDIGCDVNQASKSGETALHRACYRNRRDIVEYLVREHKPNLEAKKHTFSNFSLLLTPLYEAVVKERVEVVDFLLQEGANIDF